MNKRLMLVLFFLNAAAPVVAHDKPSQTAPQTVAVAQERLALPNFPVTDRWGNQAGFRDMVGRESSVILSFSYTECVSLCSITNAILAEVDAQIVAGTAPGVRIVTVAIDAVRDTPEAIRAEAEALASSDRWIWLTGGQRSTRPLLESLRFPPGAVEDHDPIFLVGRPCRGLYTRIVGLPDPARLVAIAVAQPACEN